MDNNKGVDLIEIGRGNQSKVIGQNNSISEYGAVALSLIAYVGQGTVVLWLGLWILLYYLDFQLLWALAISGVISVLLTVACIWAIVRLVMLLHRIQDPPQPRDERGRYVRETPVNSMGRRVGTIKTAENGQSEYIDQWGGGGR